MDTNPGHSTTEAKTVLGLDVGGSKIVIVEGTRQGQILQRHEMPTEGARPFDQTFERICGLASDTIAAATAAGRTMVAISASVPGPLKIKEGLFVNPPNLMGWHGILFKDRLANRFSPLPVFLEHDGNAGALAELHFGIGRATDAAGAPRWGSDSGRGELEHLIFLTCGTGMGAGLIVNGRIVHGASDTAGEVGHLRLACEGPRVFGKQGSFEGLAAGIGMLELARLRFPDRWTSETSIREVVDAMLADDRDAQSVVREAGEALGRGLALLIDVLNPQVIVLGALAVVLGDRLLEPARRVLAEEALPQAVMACEILPAALGKRIGDVAALMAALTEADVF
jgi:glucokinase